MIGISASKRPNAMPTRILVRASMPLRPIPIAPAKLLRPTEILTRSRGTRPGTPVTIWRCCYLHLVAYPRLFRLNSLTKTLCANGQAQARLYGTCKRVCNPKLGHQSLKRYNPPDQEAHENEAA